MERKYFYIAAIAVAVLIAVLAPFLASGNPDGLESAFYGYMVQKISRETN